MEVLWRISLKLGMSIYMDKTMMHAKWHCTTSVNNGVMALCIVVCSSVRFAPILKQNICCGGYQFYEFACYILIFNGSYLANHRRYIYEVHISKISIIDKTVTVIVVIKLLHVQLLFFRLQNEQKMVEKEIL